MTTLFKIIGVLTLAAIVMSCAHSVRIISIPSGAKVFIDNKYVGQAPLVYEERSGTAVRNYKIRSELAGFKTIEENASVKICPTAANLILDSFAVGYFFGFCLRNEYIHDFTVAEASKQGIQKGPASN